jgi:hypothetical protein
MERHQVAQHGWFTRVADNPADNVVRKEAMLRRWTALRINHYETPSWHWVATLPDGSVITESDLGPLLDRVEAELDG